MTQARIEAVTSWDESPAFRVHIGRRTFSVVSVLAPSAGGGLITLGEVARLTKDDDIIVLQRFANIGDALHWTLTHGHTPEALGERV